MTGLSVVIPTYRRGQILRDTLEHLLKLSVRPDEILIVDQTEEHPPEVHECLQRLELGIVRRIILERPSIPHAMNIGLQEAKGDIVLFLDDDIVPDKNLVSAHLRAHEEYPGSCAVVGQVLQPEEGFQESEVRSQKSESGLRRDLGFKFNSTKSVWVENVMAGNLSVKREFALRIGGFDENFIPPVSFRFETGFAKRLIAAGGKIRFEPAASIRHLRAGQGGTRSQGVHLTSASSIHGVGDYYYALLHGRGWNRFCYMAIRPFRQVRTKFHLAHPWYIPVKFIGELRALALAFRLNQKGSLLLPTAQRVVLISTTQPDRPNGSMVRYGTMVREALETHTDCWVEELNLSPTQAWLDHFPLSLQTPLRYFCIAINARRCLPKQKGGVFHLLDGSHAYFLGAVRSLPLPCVATVHDLIPALCLRGELSGERLGRAAGWIIEQSVRNLTRADVLVTVSENTRSDVLRITDAISARVRTARSAISMLSSADATEASDVKIPYVLHVAGNNTFYKNRQGVVDVFKEIHSVVPIQLKMVGAPPDEALLQKVFNSGVGHSVEFCSNVSEAELAALYRNAKLFLFPSFYEGFGWPPLEAMAQGCPVVCSNAGSLKEIAGAAAKMAPPDDIKALAKHSIDILLDDDLRQHCINEGIRHARSFSLDALAEDFMNSYQVADEVFQRRHDLNQ